MGLSSNPELESRDHAGRSQQLLWHEHSRLECPSILILSGMSSTAVLVTQPAWPHILDLIYWTEGQLQHTC